MSLRPGLNNFFPNFFLMYQIQIQESLRALKKSHRDAHWLSVYVDGLKGKNSTKELDKAIDALLLARMWCGKTMQQLGSEYPYPESKNPDSEVIEPLAVQPSTLEVNLRGNHISDVKALRAAIDGLVGDLDSLRLELPEGKPLWFVKLALQYATEGGMWLGQELGRLREQEMEKRYGKPTPEVLEEVLNGAREKISELPVERVAAILDGNPEFKAEVEAQAEKPKEQPKPAKKK